jgi:predicted component of type VI protein secretion system
MTLRTLAAAAVTVVTAVTSPVTVSIATPVAAQQPEAQPERRRTVADVLETLDRVRAFHQTAISPDGRRVA